MHSAQKLINHVALVLDASYSMTPHERSVIKVADEQIKHLALRSEELSQETRVSVYYFGDETIECLLFDMDVMRLPSIGDLYEVLYENTALIDATLKSQEDLATTSQLYGDHAFLTFVLTDGEENRSKRRATDLQRHLKSAKENWSFGFLVPNQSGVTYMERLGVLRDSIAIWDTTSAKGLAAAASAIRTATDSFMTNRASGVRGTRSVFSMSPDVVNKRTVSANLTPLKGSEYSLYGVVSPTDIKSFLIGVGVPFAIGKGYYQLTKSETIQAKKNIVVVEKSTGRAYGGAEARHLLGLPDGKEVRVRPSANPLYDIYVQSTSVNRKLVPNTKLLVRS